MADQVLNILFAVVAATCLGLSATLWVRARRRLPQPEAPNASSDMQGVAQARLEAQTTISDARHDALRLRTLALEEINERQAGVELTDALLEERDRLLRDRNHHFNQHRHSYKERRAALDAERDALAEQRAAARALIADRAGLDHEAAVAAVLENVASELLAEHPDRVEAMVAARLDEPEAPARNLITRALQRQDQGHADGAPRPSPISLEGLDEAAREELLVTLGAIAEQTTMELTVDTERAQASLRGQNPLGREAARQASLEVVERKLQVADVAPLLHTTSAQLRRRIVEIGERALWEMTMEGRPELAELIGTLHYRFSYGQNALMHCQETGYVCGVIAAELGMDQAVARQAGMLHDIGKAADHDVEGSHAIIGGELLRIFGTDAGIVHAVKAHHFDEEPSTDLAMLTICADAISASRPGARRDTLASYLARLEQLQEIATRHQGVERAFPLQAGREVRVVVKARSVRDEAIQALSHDIAREIEAEMQYPGVIKVTVIRETMATATAPAQVGSAVGSGVASMHDSSSAEPGPARRRRRGGRGRKKRSEDGGGVATATATAEPSAPVSTAE